MIPLWWQRGSAPNPAGAPPLRPETESQNLSVECKTKGLCSLPLVGPGGSCLPEKSGINLPRQPLAR
jgi:hypothetical protein